MNRKEKAALVSILVNIFQVVLKLVLASLSGSISLLADAWHSLSDIFVSLMVWTGIKISGKENQWDSKRVGRVENIVAIVISLFIFFAAYSIFRKALGVATHEMIRVPIAIVGLLVSIFTSYLISQYKIGVGRETNSPSLVADGYHSKMDMYTSIAVVVSLVGYIIGLSLEKIAAVVVALFIVEVGIVIIVNAVQSLVTDRLLEVGSMMNIGESLVGRKAGEWNKKLYHATGFRLHVDFPKWRRIAVERRGNIIACVVLVAAVIYLSSGLYRVGPGEEVILHRFGKVLSADIAPGLHYRWPFPIGSITRTKPSEIRRVELGFQTVFPMGRGSGSGLGKSYLWESSHTTGRYIKHPEEAMMLTGDENIIDINTVIHYYLCDPFLYHFQISNQESLIRNASEAAVRMVVATLGIDEILTSGRKDLQDGIHEKLQEILDHYRAGVKIFKVQLQDVHPPIEVVDAFRDVASAREDRSKMINQAIGYKNEILPLARGEAEKRITAAEAYREEKINSATGEAGKFVMTERAFRGSKEISSLRMYLETIESVLPDINKFIIESDVEKGKYDLWFLGKSQDAPFIPMRGE